MTPRSWRTRHCRYPQLRATLLDEYGALASGDAAAKTQAVHALLALGEDQQWEAVARLLGDLRRAP